MTDCPVSTSPRDDSVWDFLRTIITMGTQILAPGGKYLTHSNGKSVQVRAFFFLVYDRLTPVYSVTDRTKFIIKNVITNSRKMYN